MQGFGDVPPEDRAAVAALFTAYAHAVDTSDWGLYVSVFTPAATPDGGEAAPARAATPSRRRVAAAGRDGHSLGLPAADSAGTADAAYIDYRPAGGPAGRPAAIARWLSRVFTVLAGQHLVSNFDIRRPPADDTSNGATAANRGRGRCAFPSIVLPPEVTAPQAAERALHVRAIFHNPNWLRCLPGLRPLFSVGGWYVAVVVRPAGASEAALASDAWRGWRLRYLTESIAYNSGAAYIVAVALAAAWWAWWHYWPHAFALSA